MTHRPYLLLLSLFVSFSHAFAGQPDLSPDAIHHFTLSNGMTVLFCKQSMAPRVHMRIAYNVGARNEGPGERGLAHLLEHMIFKGTEKLSESDLGAIAAKYGATMNAFTTSDTTQYYFDVDKANWQHFLPLMADCMENTRFDNQHLASEVRAVIQELRMYADHNDHMLGERSNTFLFPEDHPYHHPVIGYKEDLAAMTGEKIKAFYDKHYSPDRAVLCMVGDFDFQEAESHARAAFEAIPQKTVASDPAFHDIVVEREPVRETFYRDTQAETLFISWVAPKQSPRNHALISLVTSLLASSAHSRIKQRIIDHDQLASNLLPLGYLRKEASVVGIVVRPYYGMRSRCEDAIFDELRSLARDGVSEEEMKAAVYASLRSYREMMYHPEQIATALVDSYTSTNDPYEVTKRTEYLCTLTCEDVQEFIKTYMNPSYATSVSCAPFIDHEQRSAWVRDRQETESYYDYLLKHHIRIAPVEDPTFVHTMPEPSKISFRFPDATHVSRPEDNAPDQIVYTQTHVPLVYFRASFKDFSSLIHAQKEGALVSLMMKLVVERANGMDKAAINAVFEKYGARFVVGRFGFSFVCPSEHIEPVLSHVVSLLTLPDFTDADFQKLKRAALHEIVQRKEDVLLNALDCVNNSVFGDDHAYGVSQEALEAYIQSLTLDDIVHAYEQYVYPGGFLMSCAGDIEPDHFDALWKGTTKEWSVPGKEKTFEHGVRKEWVPGRSLTIPVSKDQSAVVMHRPSADVKEIDPDYVPRMILSQVLFSGVSSRLFKLRERTGMFYFAGGSLGSPMHTEPGIDAIYLLINPQNKEAALEYVSDMLNTVAKDGITGDEFNVAKKELLKTYIDASAHPDHVLALMSYYHRTDFPEDYINQVIERLNNVTLDEVNQAADKYFSNDTWSVIVAGRETVS